MNQPKMANVSFNYCYLIDKIVYRKEIEDASRWVREKMDWLEKLKDDDLGGEDYDDNVDLLRNASREAETRKMTVDALSNKVNVVKADVSDQVSIPSTFIVDPVKKARSFFDDFQTIQLFGRAHLEN